MPIQIMLTKSGNADPVVVCDFCGKQIDHPDRGTFTWDGDTPSDGRLRDIYFVHSACDRLMERKIGKPLDSCELPLLVSLLRDSLKIDIETTERLSGYDGRKQKQGDDDESEDDD